MDITRLRELTRDTPIARSIFEALSNRGRSRSVTDLDRLRRSLIEEEGLAIEPREFLAVFKKFQEAGFGTVINPKKPTDNYRFKWKFNLIEVGTRALASPAGSASPGKPSAKHEVERSSGAKVRMHYPIRGEAVELNLPADLTRKEAEDLADFIRRFGR